MTPSVLTLSIAKLGLALVPALAVVWILWRWSLEFKNVIYALSRMLLQLMVIGYFLIYIFEAEVSWIIMVLLTLMLFTAAWISMGSVKDRRKMFYAKALLSIFLGGGATLIFITQVVLDLNPWFYPRYVIPIAGMIFANSMNSVSLAAERFMAEFEQNPDYEKARNSALKASLIPITNSLFAVGLVSLPGMMTGQILSGISPLIAVRYQIMVMCMIFGSAGISSACFLRLIKGTGKEN